jgi:hypothetical protein
MTIHEQITAFLNGDLTESSQVGELMHVLAVSPEKRALMVEQIRMSRAFATMGGGVAPSHALDSRLWSGIAAIDAGFPPAPPPAAAGSPSAASILASHPLLSAIASILLVGVGVGLGYLSGASSPSGPSERGRATASTNGSPNGSALLAELAATRDSLADGRSQLQQLSDAHTRTIAELERQKSAARQASTPRSHEVIRYIDRPAQTAPTPPAIAAADLALVAPLTVRPAEIMVPRVILERSAASGELQPVTAPTSTLLPKPKESRPWQGGFHNSFRVSFPRVYGIPTTSQNILNDNELYGTLRLKGGEAGMFSTFRVGAAVGQTLFSQVYHTNTGGMPVDTIYEQTPALAYARAFIAPEIGTIGDVTTAVELGGGIAGQGFGKIIGPFGTIGLNVEYHPWDLISLHGGLSAWLLWTEFRGQAYTSTNLNIQSGIMFNF